MPPTPPPERSQWNAWVNALLSQHKVDLMRLWRRTELERGALAMPEEQNVTPPTPPVCVGCPSGFSECWELAVAGVSDDQCTGCSTHNGTFVLSHVGGCQFWSDIIGSLPNNNSVFSCDTFSTRWILRYGATSFQPNSDYWSLYLFNSSASEAYLILYELAGSSFDCDGQNTFDLVSYASDFDACQGFPATLTIDPITCP